MSSVNLEAIHVGEIHSSINFKKSKENATSSITVNDNIQDVWENKFNSLALVSKKITIIDRYFYQNIIKDHKAGKETSLLKFIKLLPKSPHKHSISIYSDGEIKTSKLHTDISGYIQSNIKNNPILKSKISIIDFNSCLESYFINNAHDRLITFDDYACEIGIGMEIFSTASLRPTSFSIKPKSQSIFTTAYPKLSSNRIWHEDVSF